VAGNRLAHCHVVGHKARFLVIFGSIFGVVGLLFLAVGVGGGVSYARSGSSTDGSFLFVLFGGIGAIFTLVAAGVLYWARRITSARNWLRKHGQERWGRVDEIRRNYSVEMNGRSPFVVTVSWRDERTGRTHEAVSDYLWQRPDPELERQQVRVLVDPANPDRSLVDLGTRRASS
jgi:hypothetical protein